jgi:polyisoprenoid-binding protein YceI
MKRFALLALAAALCTPAFAVPETFVIDNNHTFPSFSYSHFGFTVQTSRFNKTSGTVVIDRAARSGSVDVVIDTPSVDTGSPLLNEHIQDADFLDTSAFPTATFKSTKVNFEGDRPVSIEGQLTLKGITRPVTLQITAFQLAPNPIVKKDAVGANATALVKRTDFNAGKYAPYVGDDVTINIAIEALKQ